MNKKIANQGIDLSIIIPALKEEKRLPRTLKLLHEYLKTDEILSTLKIEVIVVAADGGDKTALVASRWKKQLPNFKVLEPGETVGKGRDVKVGMDYATGNAAIFMDADLATPLKYIPVAYEIWKSTGECVVVGVRNLKKHHKNIFRRSISNIGNISFRILGGVLIEDSQCGFKLFSREAKKTCFDKMTIQGWGFDMELLAIAKKYNFPIQKIQINDWIHKDGGNIDGKISRQVFNSGKDLTKIFLNRVRGIY